jgi:hypothetical protein
MHSEVDSGSTILSSLFKEITHGCSLVLTEFYEYCGGIRGHVIC